jgi:hypothetical protein
MAYSNSPPYSVRRDSFSMWEKGEGRREKGKGEKGRRGEGEKGRRGEGEKGRRGEGERGEGRRTYFVTVMTYVINFQKIRIPDVVSEGARS